jgi:Protein of unknown function (DUF3455)
MKHSSVVSLVALLAAGCASAPFVPTPSVLEPPSTATALMVVPARGVQIYECRVQKSGAEWTFVAPEAELFDSKGRQIGSHGAGPNWQASDGSRIVGTVQARADAPSAGAIPWLLLSSKSSGPLGSFSPVTHVQRVNTVGGMAPSGPCTPGAKARVAYTADYVFFTNR